MTTELQFAEALARWMHRDQVDKSGRPYVEHLERVAASVSDRARAAAWLHDIVEDTTVTIDAVNEMFDTPTCGAILYLTRLPSMESYDQYIRGLADWGNEQPHEMIEIAREVKIADLRDNLSPERRFEGDESLRDRYIKALEILGETWDGEAG